MTDFDSPATFLNDTLYLKEIIALLYFVLKINESQYIALFVVSGSIRKLFSIDFVNIYFSQSIVNYLFSIDLKVWVTPHYLYRDSLTLR